MWKLTKESSIWKSGGISKVLTNSKLLVYIIVLENKMVESHSTFFFVS